MNPIKENRIIIDKSFAWRLYHFLIKWKNGEKANFGDLIDCDYLLNGAARLLAWQKNTVTEETEKEFLKDKYVCGGKDFFGSVRLNVDKEGKEYFGCHISKDNINYLYNKAQEMGLSISETLNIIIENDKSL